MSKRLARINEQLKREIATLLRREVRDPRVGIVTVTAVDVAADLAVAEVYVRMLGEAEEKKESLEGLVAAAPYVRRQLGKLLHYRHIPELRFRVDRSLEHARRIEEILDEVLPEDHAGEDPTPDGGGDEEDRG